MGRRIINNGSSVSATIATTTPVEASSVRWSVGVAVETAVMV
jgi:hypothetical protein